MTDTTQIRFTSDITVRCVQQVGGDHLVVAAARVSTSGEASQMFACDGAQDGNKGLINYLVKMRHGSPFEHGLLTFFVHAPIFVFREWHRHRIASYNEESGRYKQLDPVFYIPPPNRPMVNSETHTSARPNFVCADQNLYNDVTGAIVEVCELAYDRYLRMLNRGIAKEVARSVLPVGIYSSCWVTVNPRALMHFLSLRTRDEKAKFVSYPQYEIEVAARQIEEVFKQSWPLTYAAFVNNGRVAP